MSYRHSSYRKVKKAKGYINGITDYDAEFPRHHGNRICHWMLSKPLTKPANWGKKVVK